MHVEEIGLLAQPLLTAIGLVVIKNGEDTRSVKKKQNTHYDNV